MRNKVSPGKYVHTLFICMVICMGAFIGPAGYAEVNIERHKRGSLIIVGGGDTPYTIQKRFVELAGGPGRARVAIFPMAASLLDTRALRTIEFQYEKGAVIGGTSAGAAVMTATMLTGERRTASGRINEDPNAVALRSTEVTLGFGLLPGAIIDQHFSRRSRDNRLVSAILDNPQIATRLSV